MKEKTVFKNSIVLGLALFAMFFGAGNLIFPPAIGLEGGTSWFVGFAAYFIADVGLALFGIFVMFRAGGNLDNVMGSVGKIPSVILGTAIVVCIGPLLAIPRTAATSFEMIGALLPQAWQGPLGLTLFSLVFFGVVLLIGINQKMILDGIGKVLTPLLVTVLAVLIVAGMINPSAQAAPPAVDNLVRQGILNGYATMDMLAALIFSIIAVGAVNGFGCKDEKAKGKTLFFASMISMLLLMAVYGGLAYLGATTGQLWRADYLNGDVNQADLLANIAWSVLGKVGAVVLSAITLLACLTTAIGLTSSCSSYFSRLSNGKLSHRVCVVGICVLSCILCNAGLSQIIAFSVPVLSLVYPVALFLAIMSLFSKEPGKKRLSCIFGALAALLVSFCGVLADHFGLAVFGAVHSLPLDSFGFSWVVPAVLAALLGAAYDRARNALKRRSR